MTLLIVAVSVLGAAVITLATLLSITRSRLGSARQRVADLERGLVEVEPRSGPVAGLAGKAVRVVTSTARSLRQEGVGGLLSESFDVLERWAREDRATIVRVAAPDGTATVMFTDIEDSTPHNDTLGDEAWLKVLAAHDRIVRQVVDRHRGHVVKNQGDGFMIVFGDPTRAIDAAVDLQRTLDSSSSRALKRTPVRVRIGAHTGQVISRDGDFYGRNVAVAARVAGLAEGGEILVSETAATELGGHDLEDRGEHTLRGLSERFRLFAVRWRRDD